MTVIPYETKYSRMDQMKFVEASLSKIWSDMVCLSRWLIVESQFDDSKCQVTLSETPPSSKVIKTTQCPVSKE